MRRDDRSGPQKGERGPPLIRFLPSPGSSALGLSLLEHDKLGCPQVGGVRLSGPGRCFAVLRATRTRSQWVLPSCLPPSRGAPPRKEQGNRGCGRPSWRFRSCPRKCEPMAPGKRPLCGTSRIRRASCCGRCMCGPSGREMGVRIAHVRVANTSRETLSSSRTGIWLRSRAWRRPGLPKNSRPLLLESWFVALGGGQAPGNWRLLRAVETRMKTR